MLDNVKGLLTKAIVAVLVIVILLILAGRNDMASSLLATIFHGIGTLFSGIVDVFNGTADKM